MRNDPFAAYRNGGASYTATTGDDGRTLQLVALDLAAFHEVAHSIIAIANASGWHVAELRHSVPGGNVASLTTTPRR